jgi:hypothetical protein
MGYACPVCGDPQADAEHLANHLAFTALLGDEDHEGWLDEHAPDWDQTDADALAETVTDRAESVEFPQVFDDTTHDHGEDGDPLTATGDADAVSAARRRADRHRELDAQGEQILEDARELTRQRRSDESDAAAESAASEDESDEAETE